MQNKKTARVVLVGDKHIGKRTLLTQSFNKQKRQSDLYIPIEFVQLDLAVNGQDYNIFAFDSLTRGSTTDPLFSKLNDEFYREVLSKADAVLYAYNTDNQKSHTSLNQWYKEINPYCGQDTRRFIVEIEGRSNYRFSKETDLVFNCETLRVNPTQRSSVVDMFARVLSTSYQSSYSPVKQSQTGSQYQPMSQSRPETQAQSSYQSYNQPLVQSQSQYQPQHQHQTTHYQEVTRSYVQERENRAPVESTQANLNYSSPTRTSHVNDMRYSATRESHVVVKGSFVKRLTVVDETKTVTERTTKRLVQKAIMRDDDLAKPEDF